MAQLQKPIPPRRLYRYRSLTGRPEAMDQEVESIRDRYVYCADFSRMNDPMEGFFESSEELRTDQMYRDVIRQIRDRKLKTGLACFSETKENVLMWAHYANNYAGICIEYSSAELIAGLPRNAIVARVAYVDEIPEVSQEETRNFDDAVVYILSQKKSNWAYEREWRVLADCGKVSVGRKQPITGIYFGLRTPNAHRQRILSRMQGTGIKAYMMDVNGYEHIFKPINAAARDAEKMLSVKGG